LNVLLCGQTARTLFSGAAATQTAGLAIIAAIVTAWSSTAWSQTKTGDSVDSMEVSEHAKRQADGPMRWIMLADQPKPGTKPAAPAPNAKAAAAGEKPAPAAQPAAVKRPAVVATKPVAAPAAANSEPAAHAAQADAPPPAPEPRQEVAIAAPTPQPAAPTPPPEPEIVLKLVDMVEPIIPEALRSRLDKKASVVVHFVVAANGAVSDPEIVSASNNELKKPVLAAVRQWRYAAPGKRVEKQVELQIVAED
jgi:TonB family protein